MRRYELARELGWTRTGQHPEHGFYSVETRLRTHAEQIRKARAD